jgi:hypothetical protein
MVSGWTGRGEAFNRPVSGHEWVCTMADDYYYITKSLLKGKVVPVLGAGVNLWERPPPSFERGKNLPSGQELADELAAHCLGNAKTEGYDLALVSQYVAVRVGEGPLVEELRDIFAADYSPTHLHHFLAQLSRRIRAEAGECMLILTTNYDDSLERAFTEEREPYELITYIAEGQYRGRFRHVTASGQPTVIRTPNKCINLRLDQRTVIAKIHGGVDRTDEEEDSFVITEDHYVDYITRADVTGLFPVMLARKLKTSHFLFLGYSLRDWNFRVMLYRLWREQEGKDFHSWAIQADPDPIDCTTWGKRGVDILPVRVEDFVAAIEQGPLW